MIFVSTFCETMLTKQFIILVLSWVIANNRADLGSRATTENPLGSLKIKWYRSQTKKTFWAYKCDFQGHNPVQKSPIKVQECLLLCEEDSQCTHFTWEPASGGSCRQRTGAVLTENAFIRKAPGLRCGVVPDHIGVDFDVDAEVDWKEKSWARGCDFIEADFATQEVATLEECQDFCRSTDGCSHYTWMEKSGICGLKRGIARKDYAFLSNDFNIYCGLLEAESPEWHIIVGGKNSQDLKSVEAFNWKTKDQCNLNDLPLEVRIHSSAVFEKVPIICGGLSEDVAITRCYKYDPVVDSWQESGELLVGAAAGASSVLVPNKGWFIFGGDGNSLTRSQKLQHPDSLWELGPDLYLSKSVTGTCIVQLNDTLSVLLGGSIDPHGIVSLDWKTSTFTKMEEKLIKRRWKSACALVKSKNGDPLVAVAGGIHADGKGLEIWDPLQSTVALVSEYLPTESASSLGLNHAQLVPISAGREMVLYGGFQGDYQSEIWKFSVDKSEWEKLGELAAPREEHVVFPVASNVCPR